MPETSATHLTVTGDSDQALLAAVADGDGDALRLLYERHAASMLRLVRRLTSRAGVAEEIAQEAWIAVWQSAGTFRGQASVRAWLFGVTRRQAHNTLRRRELDVVDLDQAPEPADPEAEVEAAVLARAGHQQLMDAIRRLPEHLREPVTLAWVEEMPYRDIAAVLNIPPGTVKSRMWHARARLATILADLGVVEQQARP
jgi:RNA polymerase sigma factor (sigma-70 family)